jgi:hypothetical protein
MNALKNLLLVMASVVVSLICMELILRVGDGLPLIPSENLLLARADRFSRRAETVYDPTLGWALRPNLRAVRTRTEPSITTGELGIRMNRPEIVPPAHGAIVTVGDSFTMGAEVDDTSTWPAQLEQRIGEAVVNGGTGGYGTDQIILRAEQLLNAINPKTIVVSFLSDDVMRSQLSVYNGAAKPYFLLKDGQLLPMHQPVPPPAARPPLTVPFPRNILGYSYLVTWTMARFNVASWFLITKNTRVATDHVGVTCRLLERLKRQADTRGVRLVFMMQWPGEAITKLAERPSYAARVLHCAIDLGLQTVDPWEALKAVHARGKEAFYPLYNTRGDGVFFLHMSRAGNALIADLMARAIQDKNFNVLPPYSPRRPAPRLNLEVLGEGATVQNLTVARNAGAAPAGSAVRLENTSMQHGSIFQDVPVADDDLTHTFSLNVRPGDSGMALVLLAYLGGQQRVYQAHIETPSMVVNGEGSITSEPLADGWWKVTVSGPNNRSGNRSLRVQVFPSQDPGRAAGSFYIADPRLDP